MSNQAVLEQIAPVTPDREVEVAEVRRIAEDLVERGLFAAHAEARPAATIAKYVDVLQRSRLPSDRKAVLVQKLVGDQEAALAACGAVERYFGPGPEGTEQALDVLGAVWEGLRGEPPADLSGGVAERAEAWIRGLAGERGEAVTAFCREVHLLFALDEEEEEDAMFSSLEEE